MDFSTISFMRLTAHLSSDVVLGSLHLGRGFGSLGRGCFWGFICASCGDLMEGWTSAAQATRCLAFESLLCGDPCFGSCLQCSVRGSLLASVLHCWTRRLGPSRPLFLASATSDWSPPV